MIWGIAPLQAVYIGVFAATAIVCFAAISRARTRLDDSATRWGLVTLLATSGSWAAFHVGRIAVPFANLKLTFYVLGLIFGLSTVGAWLYFCSAYADKPYHRQPLLRRLALLLYLSIVSIKITSPIHGLYFTTSIEAVPFEHLAIDFGVLHWVTTGISYALSAIGFYILFDLFKYSMYATKRLGALVALAGLPVVMDIIGYLSPGFIITLNYEPIGVALFALGVLYVADGTFVAVRRFGREQLFDDLSEGIVILDQGGIIRDANDTAKQLFPTLADNFGRSLSRAIPDVGEQLPVAESGIIEIFTGPDIEYWLFSTQELDVGQTTIGRTLVFTDVTEVEHQRRQLANQQDQMDEFAAALTHELRNALMVIGGRAEFIANSLDKGTDNELRESIKTVIDKTAQMTDLVGDLAMLAQYGQRVETTEPIDITAVIQETWADVAPEACQLDITGLGTINADRGRLARLFENLFEFAIQTGATEVSLTQTDAKLIATSNGQPLTDVNVERVFAFGQAVPDAESGMFLPIVRTLAEAHGWSVTLDTAYQDGIKIIIET